MEITYKIEVEQDDTRIRGNLCCTDDDEQDTKEENEVFRRLDNGDIYAWCLIKVTATFGRFSHSDYLVGNSLKDGSEVEEQVEFHGMKQEARLGLIKEIKQASTECSEFLSSL
jgi:hypothetical protein